MNPKAEPGRNPYRAVNKTPLESAAKREKLKKTTSQQFKRVNYPDLDLLKLIMSLLVVEIHTRPLLEFSYAERIIESIDVIAVPFFFLASSFLCFRGLNEKAFFDAAAPGAMRVRNTIIKLTRLYFIWTLIFLPVTIFGNKLLGKSHVQALLSFLRGTLLIGENCYSWPLWYLLASIVAYALIYYLLRKGMRLNRIIPLSFFLLLIGYVITYLQNWNSAPIFISFPIKIYTLIFGSSRNGLFEGFFYISMGAAFGMKWNSLNKTPASLIFAIVAIGIIGNLLISNDAHLPFCALASIGIFLITVRRYGSNLDPHVGARHMSTITYLVHMILVVIFIYGINCGTNPDLYANSVNRLLLYLFTLCGSFLISSVVITASKKKHFLKTVFGI